MHGVAMKCTDAKILFIQPDIQEANWENPDVKPTHTIARSVSTKI